ncbi:hypothetical protein QUF54_07490, partial [Candidatus Marithioploca araucensis]|nr:hypothetical protein [Candidatus Marithioploca araucensis]
NIVRNISKLIRDHQVFRLTTITTRIVYKKGLKNANDKDCLSEGIKNANDKDCLTEGIDPILSYKQSL